MNSAGRSLPIFAYLSPLVGLATGYGATALQSRFAPIGLFPLLVGAATGLGVIACMRLAACECRRGLVAAAVAAALVCTGVMHYASYQAARAASDAEWEARQRVQQAFPQGKLDSMPTPIGNFGDFVTRQLQQGRPLGGSLVRGNWLIVWWTVDALLLIVGAAATAYFLAGPPTPVLVEGPTA